MGKSTTHCITRFIVDVDMTTHVIIEKRQIESTFALLNSTEEKNKLFIFFGKQKGTSPLLLSHLVNIL